MEKQKGFEYTHLECPQSWVNSILQQYAMFYWELVGTQTVVSKESHLERGGLFDSDTIYSVTTTERFATVDLKRDLNRPNLDKVRTLETQYFDICNDLMKMGCSPVNNYSPPPSKSIGITGILLYCCYIIPGIWYSSKVKSDNQKTLARYQQVKGKLDKFIKANNQLLNV
jgi:hypothetical protein